MKVDFDAASHSYRIDDVLVPSVTQALTEAGLIDYSFLRADEREVVLARGRRVHLATQFDDDNDLDFDSVPAADQMFVIAWRKFRATTGFVVIESEKRVGSSLYGYAGTLDVAGYFPTAPHAPVIVDKKTGHAEWWTRIQTAAYAACLSEPRKYRRICVELHADSTFAVPAHLDRDGRHWHDDFQDYLAALRVCQLKRKHQRTHEVAAA